VQALFLPAGVFFLDAICIGHEGSKHFKKGSNGFFVVARNFRILRFIIMDAETNGFGILLLHVQGAVHCNVKLKLY
jgi:hypothetical protein